MSWIMRSLEKEVKKNKTINPFELAKNKKIIIRYLPLGNTLGFYMKNARQKIITLNCNNEDGLMRFVCAHELGHAVMHPNENTPFLHKNTLFSKDKIEREANEFAVNLILYNTNLTEYETKYDLLRENGIPYEMERFIK
jgi:Zn-dependent peptidase ImmA (M78 family)